MNSEELNNYNLTVREAAIKLGTTPRNVHYLIERQKVKYTTIKGQYSEFEYRLSEVSVNEWLLRRQEKKATAATLLEKDDTPGPIKEEAIPKQPETRLITTTNQDSDKPPARDDNSWLQAIIDKIKVEAAKWKAKWEHERESRIEQMTYLRQENRGLREEVNGYVFQLGEAKQRELSKDEKIKLLASMVSSKRDSKSIKAIFLAFFGLEEPEEGIDTIEETKETKEIGELIKP